MQVVSDFVSISNLSVYDYYLTIASHIHIAATLLLLIGWMIADCLSCWYCWWFGS